MSLLCTLFGCMLDLREGASCRAFSPDREGNMAGYSRETRERWDGATLEDCIKLWSTIRDELMADATITVALPEHVEPGFRPCLMVSTQGWDEKTGVPMTRIWSTRVLGNGSIGFTYNALYECLIVSHRAMEGFLGGQLELPGS